MSANSRVGNADNRRSIELRSQRLTDRQLPDCGDGHRMLSPLANGVEIYPEAHAGHTVGGAGGGNEVRASTVGVSGIALGREF